MRSIPISLTLLLCLVTLPALAAEGDSAPATSAPAAMKRPEAGLAMPAQGMSMRQVEKKFGKPLKVLPPTGPTSKYKPPITRWIYPDYIVYFERNLVIHSAKPRDPERFRKLKESAPPAPSNP